MSPSQQIDEISMLRHRLAEAEAELQRQQRREQLSEARFRLLADSAPVMIWIAGPDGQRNYFNRSWLEFRNRSFEDECGNGWTVGLHPDDREFCLENHLKAYSTRQAYRIQYRLLAGSEYRWVEDTAVPLIDENGSFAGFMGAVSDIHERKCGILTPDEDAVRMVFSLTERERQVLVLIANGKSTREAATELGISYKTADSHRSRILEKLGVHETASMVRYAIRAGLIGP